MIELVQLGSLLEKLEVAINGYLRAIGNSNINLASSYEKEILSIGEAIKASPIEKGLKKEVIKATFQHKHVDSDKVNNLIKAIGAKEKAIAAIEAAIEDLEDPCF